MKDYFKKEKGNLLWLIIGILIIFVTSLTGSLIQSKGGSIAVSDLRNAENTGTKEVQVVYQDGETQKTGVGELTIEGEVKSGILYVPKEASKDNKVPGIVLTHGYLNNREMQLPFAVELARRGYVVLTVDREGHGNYENSGDQNAMMATNGLYQSAKYLYNLDFVDQDRIGITGHSMGGFTTAMALMSDATPVKDVPVSGTTLKGTALAGTGIIKAGLMQGWSSFFMAGADVSVGMLKAKDDEFFFQSVDENGNPTICRQYLNSQGAAKFVGETVVAGQKINITNGGKYVGGKEVTSENGLGLKSPFRVIYEADEIHPLNHWSIPSTAYVVDFFYTAFDSPNGEVIPVFNQVWYIKEGFSFVGMLALLSLIIPLVGLALSSPLFRSLRYRTDKKVNENGTLTLEVREITKEYLDEKVVENKKWYSYVLYFLPAIISTLFAGFSIRSFVNEWGDRWFPNTQLYPQDTTNWVALWSVACGLFALLMVIIVWCINYGISKCKEKKSGEKVAVSNPFDVLHISSLGNVLKTIGLALLVITCLFLIVFINWQTFMVDFRLWTWCIKVFNVPELVPTMCRYFLFFFIYYLCQGICNQTYINKNMPEWLTTAINAFFNVFGICLVITIQYATFKSTGVLWQGDMALGYIVLFPIIPILITATIVSRILFKKTGNVYLGSLINAMLWTIVTVSGTAASFSYVLG